MEMDRQTVDERSGWKGFSEDQKARYQTCTIPHTYSIPKMHFIPLIVIHIIQALYQYVVFLQYHINPFTAYYHTVLLHRYLKEDFLKYVKHHSEN